MRVGRPGSEVVRLIGRAFRLIPGSCGQALTASGRPELALPRVYSLSSSPHLFFFLSPSECKGFKCISEASAEIAFLLVEN